MRHFAPAGEAHVRRKDAQPSRSFAVIVAALSDRAAGPWEDATLEHLERQKRLTRRQWRIIATANLGDMLDCFDFFLVGYVLAFIIGS